MIIAVSMNFLRRMFNDYPIFIKLFKASVDKCREYKN